MDEKQAIQLIADVLKKEIKGTEKLYVVAIKQKSQKGYEQDELKKMGISI